MYKEGASMGNAGKMQGFLQRMLRRSDEELSEGIDSTLNLQASELSKSNLMKASWLKKFGNCSANGSFQIQSSVARPTTLKDLGSCRRRSAPAPSTPRRIPVVPGSSLEMPDLESIIREFEMGYLSPTKHEPVDCMKQGNFVKKIVAAFEVKYKAFNDLKDEQDVKASKPNETNEQSSEEGFQKNVEIDSVEMREPVHSSPKNSKRRSGFFGSPFKDSKNADKCNAASEKDKRSGIFSTPCSKEQKISRRSGFFLSPFRISQDTPKSRKSMSSSPIQMADKGTRELNVTVTKDECDVSEIISNACSPLKIFKDSQSFPRKNFDSTSSLKSMDDSKSTDSGVESPSRMLRIDSVSSTQDSISSSPCASPDQGSKSSDSGNSSPFKFSDQDSGCADRESLFSSPFKTTHDDTKSVRSIDLSISLPDVDDTTLLCEDQDAEGRQHNLTINTASISSADKTPKIVGAFLKKPIEVEDTSVDWIPITGKKLPRKRSLKKLLSMLTRKKTLERKSKILFRSERNLCEESRELQDSGYDEKSCSSSSLTSLVSVTDILLRQDHNAARREDRRNTIMRTFRSNDCLNDEEEMCGPSLKDLKKKLFFTEIRREDVKLDLGPSYPSPCPVSMSLDRRVLPKRTPSIRSSPKTTNVISRVPKHPFLSKIPKHPFVSMTKDDFNADCGLLIEEHQTFVRNDPVDVTTEINSDADVDYSAVTIRNDLYEVEFRRSPEEIRGTASCRSSTSDESIYDIPRPFISLSESEIPKMFRQPFKNSAMMPIYDVPKTRASARPKSSLYDDALSLKRRTAGMVTSVPDFYSVANDEEPHYATVNPRNNKRICLSEEMLRSCRDLARCDKKTCLF